MGSDKNIHIWANARIKVNTAKKPVTSSCLGNPDKCPDPVTGRLGEDFAYCFVWLLSGVISLFSALFDYSVFDLRTDPILCKYLEWYKRLSTGWSHVIKLSVCLFLFNPPSLPWDTVDWQSWLGQTLKSLMLLPLSPECWDYMQEAPHSFYDVGDGTQGVEHIGQAFPQLSCIPSSPRQFLTHMIRLRSCSNP